MWRRTEKYNLLIRYGRYRFDQLGDLALGGCDFLLVVKMDVFVAMKLRFSSRLSPLIFIHPTFVEVDVGLMEPRTVIRS